MPKPDRKPDPDFEPDYNIADIDYDEADQNREYEITDPDYGESADPAYDEEPQAEYELGGDPDYEDVPQVELVAAAPAPVRMVVSASDYAFELGRPVVPASQQQAHPIVWRGLLRERHPATGLVQRVPVYRLADGFWDCYREEELRAA